MPLWNPTLMLDGRIIAVPDAYWEEAGVALEVESREYHFYERGWGRTLKMRSRMNSHGIFVLQAPPSRIYAEPAGLIEDMVRMYKQGLSRGALPLQIIPA